MTADPVPPLQQEALVRSLYNGALRLWRYAGGPDVPVLFEPFEAAGALAIVREMLEGLMQHRAPRTNIAEMARTSEGETAKFYRRVVARKDGHEVSADRPGFTDPLDEAGLLRGIIGVTLTTMPDDVIIGLNRAASSRYLEIHVQDQTPGMEEMALCHEMDWYQDVMDRSGVTARYLVLAKQGAH